MNAKKNLAKNLLKMNDKDTIKELYLKYRDYYLLEDKPSIIITEDELEKYLVDETSEILNWFYQMKKYEEQEDYMICAYCKDIIKFKLDEVKRNLILYNEEIDYEYMIKELEETCKEEVFKLFKK
jgi:hypothetical protein